jgi:organic hydroperoxide reductase OsmC/OhrA
MQWPGSRRSRAARAGGVAIAGIIERLAASESIAMPYTVTVEWSREGATFTDRKYSRAHYWCFDGGAVVPGSSSPHVVPVPMSDASSVDPEEAFVAALASCHMLWFLSIAAGRGFVVDRYTDEAVGVMARNDRNKLAMTEITLHPRVRFAGKHPSVEEHEAMHDEAHDECFIANSVTSVVTAKPTIE